MTLNRQRIATAFAGIGLVASLFFATAATAAPGGAGGPGGGHSEKRFEKMQSELNLTPDQATRIKSIMEANRGEMKMLHEQMKNTFTPDQQAKMQSWRENREKGQRPDKTAMKEKWNELGLSDGQRQQLKSYREQMKTKRENTKSQIDAVLTPEQQARMAALKAERKGKHGKRHGDKSSK